MSLFGKGYSKSVGKGVAKNFDGNGRHVSTSKTNSAGVTSTHTPGGKHIRTSGRMNFGKVNGGFNLGGKGKAGF